MNRLLKLQVRNIFHNKLFYVCLGINALLGVGFDIISLFLSKSAETATAMPKVLATFTSGVGIIEMIFITVFCTFDFSEGTTKNIIGRGYSKIKLLLSKYIASLIGVLSMLCIISLLEFIVFIKNGFGYENYMLISLIVSLFGIIAYTVLHATIAFSLEKTSSAIIANMFGPNIIMLGLTIADTNLKTNISDYWIGNVATKFTENPTLANSIFPIVMYIVYIVLISFIGMYIAKNKEIK